MIVHVQGVNYPCKPIMRTEVKKFLKELTWQRSSEYCLKEVKR